MNIVINAPSAVHDDLLSTIMAKIQLDGHQVETNNFGDTCFLVINPAAQEPEPMSTIPSDVDRIDNQTLTPEPLPDIAVEVPVQEPAVDIPVATVTVDTVVLPSTEKLPAITILSLTSQAAVSAVKDTSVEFSRLEVSGVNTPNGLVNFWYCGIEFNMPKAVEADRSAVLNTSHLIGQTTIRVVIRAPNGSVMPLLIDVIGVGEVDGATEGSPELLVVGNDVVI